MENLIASGDALYASTADGILYVSRDGGGSWQVLTRRLPGRVIAALGGDPTTLVASGAKGLFVSADDGKSWAPWFCASWVAAVAATPDGDTVFAAGGQNIVTGQGGGLYMTTDRGRTWTRYEQLPSGNQNVNAVAIDPRATSHVFVATETGGVLVSSNGGRRFQWRTIGKPIPGLPHGPQITAFAISTQAPQTIWAGTRENGVYRGTSYGRQWIQNGLRRRFVDDIALDPEQLDSVYAGESGVVSLNRNSSKPHTFLSRGGGWTEIPQLPGEWALAADGTSGTIYAWRGRVIKATTDHGRSWHSLAKFP